MPSESGINPIPELLESLYEGLLPHTEGEVASYIPELSRADPSRFGLALSTLDGQVYSCGDAGYEFTMQSVSKPFVYALALARHGLDFVLERVGVEPSGDSFNAISLEKGTGRPANAMVNAGAILTTSLLAGFDDVLQGLSAFAGRVLSVDERVFQSELETGDRNRALAYLMRNSGALVGGVEEAVSVYFRQCSVNVTASDLAVMSAVLGNLGVHPVSGERVVDADTAVHVLTIMATCGMYDFAGEWLLRVGLPAKGGVSGALAAALPGQFGIGVFSPPLDARGNSVRAIAACEELSARFGLHVMRPVMRSVSAYSVASDQPVAVRVLQGDIGFAGAELLARDLAGLSGDTRWLILDVDRVSRLHPVAERLLGMVVTRLRERGVTTVLADSHERALLGEPEQRFSTLDAALRWVYG